MDFKDIDQAPYSAPTQIPDQAVQARENIEKIARSFINEGNRDYTQDVCSALKNVGLELLDALNALPYLTASVEVGELEWAGSARSPQAITILGTYKTGQFAEKTRLYHLGGSSYQWYDTLEQAKAAAQVDFERRILSQIVTKPVDLWQDIATAPKDGTNVDLWSAEFGRQSDCYWGKPEHHCGEAGQYCDSEWHGDPKTWICSATNHTTFDDITHWMPLPATPTSKGGE